MARNRTSRNGLTGDELYKEIIRLSNTERLSAAEIGRRFNITRQRVSQILLEYDKNYKSWTNSKVIKIAKSKCKPTLEQLKTARHDGATLKEISKEYGVPYIILKYYLDTDHFPSYFLKENE